MGGLGIRLLFPQYRPAYIEVLQGTWNYSFRETGKVKPLQMQRDRRTYYT